MGIVEGTGSAVTHLKTGDSVVEGHINAADYQFIKLLKTATSMLKTGPSKDLSQDANLFQFRYRDPLCLLDQRLMHT